VYRTHEIKSNILKFIKDPREQLIYVIKDLNFRKFKEIFGRNKINKEARDSHGNSLLNLAVQSNSYDIALFLINQGADVNSQNVSSFKIEPTKYPFTLCSVS
jgi:ankyrin repeat protein